MTRYIVLFFSLSLLSQYDCSSQSFPRLSKKLEIQCTPHARYSKNKTFHDLRISLYDSGKLNFINTKVDTIFLLESYDIQSASYQGRIWNTKGFIQYEYDKRNGFQFDSNKKLFTDLTIELVQKWDTSAIRKEEKLYSHILPVIYIYSARIIIKANPTINCFRFKEFFNSKRD